MTSPASRIGRTVFNLLLALVNATLILVAICLYLELRVVQKMDSLTTTFSQNLVTIDPLRESVENLSGEVSDLRADLQNLRETPGKMTAAAEQQLSSRIDQLSAQLTSVKTKFDNVVQNPDVLVDKAVDAGTQAIVQGIADLRGCTLPSDA